MSQVTQAFVFIDANVADVQHLLSGVRPGYQAHILAPDQDGMAQITALLQATPAAPRTIHIISHGAPGSLFLGNVALSLNTLSHYAAALQTWCPAASSLYLYGCNVAAGDAGAEFIEQLHHLTGAAIAASTSRVGNAEQGGSWHLDVAIGNLEQPTALIAATQQNYQGTFITVDNTTSGAVPDNGDDVNPLIRTFEVTEALSVTSVALGLNITHPYRRDLRVILTSPQGTSVTLIANTPVIGAEAPDNYDLLLQDGSSGLIDDGNDDNTAAPLYGDDRTAAPSNPFSAFNGESSLGTWTLTISDFEEIDVGTFNSARLFINEELAPPNTAPVIETINLAVTLPENNTATSANLNPVTTDADGTTTFTYAISGGADAALFTINPTTGAVRFNTAQNFELPSDAGNNGVYNIEVVANDGTDNSAPRSVSITLTNVNDAPINQGNFLPTVINVNEDSSYAFNTGVITNQGGTTVAGTPNPIQVFDPDANEVFNSVALSVSAGALTLTTTGLSVTGNGTNTVTITGATAAQVNTALASLRYAPPANFNSPDNSPVTFRIRTTDDEGLFDVDEFVFNVVPVNDAATIDGDFSGSVTESVPDAEDTVTGTLTATDPDATDPDNVFIAQSSTNGDYGTFSLTSDGNWTYTLTAELPGGFTDSDSFTIQSIDGTLETITITVNGTNDPAIIEAADLLIDIDTDPVITGIKEDSIPGGNGTLTVSDPDGPAEEFFVAKTGASALDGTYGRLTVFANGNLDYVLDDARAATQSLSAGQTVFDTFTVQTVDGTTQDIKVEITGNNDPATIGGIATGSVQENSLTNTVSNVLTIQDVDSASAGFTPVTDAVTKYGSFSINSTGQWTYTLNNADPDTDALQQGQSVTDSYTVSSSDSTATKTVTVTILGSNDAPRLTGPVAASASEDAGTFTVNLLNGASDVDGGTLTVNSLTLKSGNATGVSLLNSSTLSVNPNAYNFLPAGQNQTIVYGYTIKDGQGGSTNQTATITITGVNDTATIGGTISGALTEDASPTTLTKTGNLTIADPDTGEANFKTTVTPLGATVGNLTITTSGSWTYTVNNTNAAVQSLGAGDQLIERFSVQSADGTDSETITITVTGVNDSATITGTKIGSVTEDAAATLTATGSLSVVDVDAEEAIFSTVVTPVGSPLGSLSISTSGSWSYALDNSNPTVQALKAGATLTESFTVSSLDGTDTETITVTVTGINDSATITGTKSGSVTEDVAVAAGNLTATGSLTVADIDTGEAFFSTTVTPVGTTVGSLTIGTSGTWVYTLNNSASAVQSLAAGDDLVEVFTVKSLDGTATETITITVNGADDAATITGTKSGSVTEDTAVTAGTLTATGTLTVTDVDSGDASFNPTVTPGGENLGSLTITPDGKWVYTLGNNLPTVQSLGAGDSFTESFNVQSQDGSAIETITITVNGVNDSATITGTATGIVAEDSAPTTLTATGTLTVTDVDTGENIFDTTSVQAIGDTVGSLAIAANGEWLYTIDNTATAVQSLGVGETLTESFTVKSLDGTATQTITVTVTGVEDAATITGDTVGTLTEDAPADLVGGILTATGTLTVADDDADEAFFTPGLGTPTTLDTLGSLSITADGDWTYTVDNAAAAVQSLGAGDSFSSSFTVQSVDGTATETITVTVNGVNDSATITGNKLGSVTEDTAASLTATGTLTVTDVDAGEAIFNDSVVTPVGDTLGGLTISADGKWTYTLDSGLTGVQSLGAGDTRQESFTVKSFDGTATETITVTINGVNDGASIIGTKLGSVVEDTGVNPGGFLTATGNFTVTDVDTDEAGLNSASVTSVGTTKGSLSATPAGQWTYTINNNLAAVQSLKAGQSFTDAFTVSSADGTATETISVTVTGVNDLAVVGGDRTGNVAEDGLLLTSGTLTITDADTGEASFQAIASAAGDYGTFTLGTNGVWGYTLNNSAVQNFAGGEIKTDSFTVKSFDGFTLDTVTINITGKDDPATIGGIFLGTVDEDGDTNLSTGIVTVVDVDSADQVFVADTIDGKYGTFTIAADGNWVYTLDNEDPDTDALSDDDSVLEIFEVGVADGTTKNITITVEGKNDAPKGPLTGAIANSAEDQTRQLLGTTLLQGFSDPESDPIVVKNLTAQNGAIISNPNGSFTYTPTANYNGLETLTFEVFDGTATTVGVTRTFQVTPVNDAPTGTPTGTLPSTNEDTAVILNISDLTAGFTDIDNDPLTVTNVTPSNGTVVNNGNGTLTYTPGRNFNGTTTFTYTVTDGNGGNVANQSRTLTVNPINDVPTGAPTGVIPNTPEDTNLTINRSTLIAGFTDADGDEITIKSIAVDGGIGTITPATGSGPFVYTPIEDYTGEVTLVYTIQDGNGGFVSNLRRTFNVTPVNDAPTLTGAPGVVEDGVEDTALTILNSDLVAGYTDIDGDDLFAVALTASNGTITDNEDGTFTYTPAANFNGEVTLTYTVTDNNGGNITGITRTFTVAAVNDAPTGSPIGEIADTNENTDLIINISDLLAGFSDVDDAELFILDNLVQASAGALSPRDATSYLYTPNPGFTGTVTLTYAVTDGEASIAGVTREFEVIPVNDPPLGRVVIAGNPTEDATLTVNTTALTDQDGLPNASTFTYQWQASADGLTGWADIAGATGSTFVPGDAEVGFFLRAMVFYTDGIGTDEMVTSEATAQAIANINDMPTGSPTAVLPNGTEDTPYTILLSDLLQGFEDADVEDVLSVTDLTATNGTIAPDGEDFTFTPDADFFGVVTLTYTVQDQAGAAIPNNSLSFTLNAVNDLPVVTNPLAISLTEDDAVTTVNLLEGASDVDNLTLTVKDLTPTGEAPQGVTVSGNTLSIDPSAYNFLGAEESATLAYSYTIDDGAGGSVAQTLEITINGVNDAPIGAATGKVSNLLQDTTLTIDQSVLLAGFSDPDASDTLTVINLVASNGAIAPGSTPGTFAFTPSEGFSGSVTLTYDVTDGIESIAGVTQTVRVLPPTVPPAVFNFQQFVQFNALDEGRAYTGVVPLSFEIGRINLAALYDETYYLSQNQDIANAVASGAFSTGFEHFAQLGYLEGRNPSLYFNESLYRQLNPDVNAAFEGGQIASSLLHYLLIGHEENRIASEFFDPNDYLTNNPDVAAAVGNGAFRSAFEHYIEFGAAEGREQILLFEERFYRAQNPDVDLAIATGVFQSGFEHFARFGQRENRDPSDLFDESAYLGSNPDVAAAVASNVFSSGFEHFFRFGRAEGRPLYTEATFADA